MVDISCSHSVQQAQVNLCTDLMKQARLYKFIQRLRRHKRPSASPSIIQIVVARIWKIVQVVLQGLSAVPPFHKRSVETSRDYRGLVRMPRHIPDNLLASVRMMVRKSLDQLRGNRICNVSNIEHPTYGMPEFRASCRWTVLSILPA